MMGRSYPDTMSTDAAEQAQRDAWAIGGVRVDSVPVLFVLGLAVSMASFYVMGAGVHPLVVLAVALTFFVVSSVVGTRRLVRRREAARDAAIRG